MTNILLIIAILLIVLNFVKGICSLKENKISYLELIKETYFKNVSSYFMAFGMVITLLILSVFTNMILPSILKQSIYSFFIDEIPKTNVMMQPVQKAGDFEHAIKYVYLFFVWMVFFFILPLFAYIEEDIFRSINIDHKSIFISSLFFALVHLPMGIPLYVLPFLFIVGLILGYYYRSMFLKSIKLVYSDEVTEEMMLMANRKATFASTRLHSIYNLFLVSLGVFIVL